MKKVWNTTTRSYEHHAEGILVDQKDYTIDEAYIKWVSRGGNNLGRKKVVKVILGKMYKEKATFDKHHHFLEAIEQKILEENASYVATYLGKANKKIAYSSIPQNYRAAIRTIINGTPHNYDRGKHTTKPSISAAVKDFKEYHLDNKQNGRATTATHNGMLFIYYSNTHAAATYNYHLVTIKHKGTEVPMIGGTRDGLIKNPII